MLTLQMHDELRERGAAAARWRVVDPTVRDGCIRLFDRNTRSETFETWDVIRTKTAAELIVVERESAPRLALAVQGDATLDAKNHAAQEQLSLLEEIQKKLKCSFGAAYHAAVGKDGGPPLVSAPLPPLSTIYRYRKAAQGELPIFRGDKNKGNRTPRYEKAITDLLEVAAETQYLVPGSTWDLGDLTHFLNSEAHTLKLLAPNKKVSREFVSKYILEHLSVDPEIDRMDPELRAAAKSIGAQRIVVAEPFDRVEQDSLHLPIKINYHGQEVNNVWLVHSICCGTGMPSGWHLMVGQPSESDGLNCVESTLYSKRAAFERLGIKGIDIDVCGTMRKLVLDNGPEGRGERMLRLARLGITVNWCKSRHAHHKPYIERLNRSLKKALQRLTGSTRHDGKDGARDPVDAGERLMTLEELECWIVRWYYEKWAKTELKRHWWSDFHHLEKLGRTPEQRWMNFQKRGYVMKLSPPLSAWQMTRFEHDERMLNRKTGISLDKFDYKGANLKKLIAKYGEVKVKILFDPDDFRQIFVFDGEGMPLVPLFESHVTAETPAYSFAYMKAQRAELAAQAQADPVSEKFDRDVHQHAVETSATRKSKSKKPSKREQNKAGAQAAKETAAVNRAGRRPLSEELPHNPAEPAPTTAYAFDDEVAELKPRDRSTGKPRL